MAKLQLLKQRRVDELTAAESFPATQVDDDAASPKSGPCADAATLPAALPDLAPPNPNLKSLPAARPVATPVRTLHDHDQELPELCTSQDAQVLRQASSVSGLVPGDDEDEDYIREASSDPYLDDMAPCPGYVAPKPSDVSTAGYPCMHIMRMCINI